MPSLRKIIFIKSLEKQLYINNKNKHIIWDKIDYCKDKKLINYYLKKMNYLECKNILIKLILNNN